MARGITRKIVGTGTIGAGLASAGAAVSNAMGPSMAPDPGMNFYEAQQVMQNWHPADLGTAALVGGAVGLGVGIYNRRKEMKNEQGQHEALNKDQFKGKK